MTNVHYVDDRKQWLDLCVNQPEAAGGVLEDSGPLSITGLWVLVGLMLPARVGNNDLIGHGLQAMVDNHHLQGLIGRQIPQGSCEEKEKQEIKRQEIGRKARTAIKTTFRLAAIHIWKEVSEKKCLCISQSWCQPGILCWIKENTVILLLISYESTAENHHGIINTGFIWSHISVVSLYNWGFIRPMMLCVIFQPL